MTDQDQAQAADQSQAQQATQLPNVEKVHAANSLGITFVDRHSYRSWRIFWARRYNDVATKIRQARVDMHDFMDKSWRERRQAQSDAEFYSGVATTMLLLLEEGKMTAAQQMGKPRSRKYHHCKPPVAA